MRYLTILTASTFLLAASEQVLAGTFPQAGFSRAEGAPIVLVQEKPAKDETLKQKAKRVWRNIAGYKFDVSCSFGGRTYAETGKNHEDARGKCIARNPFCWVADAK